MIGLWKVEIEDESNTFNKFSLLKDHDVNYIQPSQLQQQYDEEGDVSQIGRKNRECKSRKTSS